MSPHVLAHLQALARQTRRDVTICRREGQRVNVTHFYRPAELARMYAHCRPRYFAPY
jgi:hypothetical protein